MVTNISMHPGACQISSRIHGPARKECPLGLAGGCLDCGMWTRKYDLQLKFVCDQDTIQFVLTRATCPKDSEEN